MGAVRISRRMNFNWPKGLGRTFGGDAGTGATFHRHSLAAHRPFHTGGALSAQPAAPPPPLRRGGKRERKKGPARPGGRGGGDGARPLPPPPWGAAPPRATS